MEYIYIDMKTMVSGADSTKETLPVPNLSSYIKELTDAILGRTKSRVTSVQACRYLHYTSINTQIKWLELYLIHLLFSFRFLVEKAICRSMILWTIYCMALAVTFTCEYICTEC